MKTVESNLPSAEVIPAAAPAEGGPPIQPAEGALLKSCSKCGVQYPATEEFFHRERKNNSGLAASCKDCRHKYYLRVSFAISLRNKDRRKNRTVEEVERDRRYSRIYQTKNRAKLNAAARKRWQAGYNKKANEKKRRYYASNIDYCREKNRRKMAAYSRRRNKDPVKLEAYRAYQKLFRRSPEHKKWRSRYEQHKKSHCPEYKLEILLRTRMLQALRCSKKSAKTMELTGCSLAELKNYLESLFLPGMTWENHTRSGWHIDHIVPCAAFDLSDPAQQRACFHYTNLQPLWAKTNLKKSNKLPEEI